MGLSNFNKYRLTDHAYERYRERFRPGDSNKDITNTVKGWLSQAEFLSKEAQGRETWFNQKDKVVVIVQPKTFMVITLYSNLAEYREKDEKENNIHPIVNKMLSDLVEAKEYSVKTEYQAKLGAMYLEYGDMLDRLSRTTRKQRYIDGEINAYQIKSEIDEIETEFEAVKRSMKEIINKGVKLC